MPTDTDTRRAVALRSISVMADGTIEDFEEVLHPEFLNHEQKDEPPAARGIGPSTAYATALWLRDAFADLRWESGQCDEGCRVQQLLANSHASPFVHEGRAPNPNRGAAPSKGQPRPGQPGPTPTGR